MGGQVVSIASGVESDGDPNQGVILIYHAPNFMFSKTDPDVYLTPIKVGATEIISVTGTQFMLAQAYPNQFGPCYLVAQPSTSTWQPVNGYRRTAALVALLRLRLARQ